MTASCIKIVAHNLPCTNGASTYFVDRVDDDSHSNLRSTKDLGEARRIAREFADQWGLRVVDETYAKQVVAYHRAAGAAVYLIATAQAKAAAQRRTCGAASTFQAEIDALFAEVDAL